LWECQKAENLDWSLEKRKAQMTVVHSELQTVQRWAHCWAVQRVSSSEKQRGYWRVGQMVAHLEY
jgi:hypothetical protein